MTTHNLPAGWRWAKLSEVLSRVSRPIQVQSDDIYSFLGVRWYALGPFIRERKPGSKVKAKSAYRVESGDVIYNKLFAYKGAFTLVSEEFAGSVVSSEFPTFRVKSPELEPRYLEFFFLSEWFWQLALNYSTGTTPSRLRLKPENFLRLPLPLPSLPAQRRIVAVLEQADELRRKRAEAARLTDQILPALFVKMFGDPATNPMGWEVRTLGEVLKVDNRSISPIDCPYRTFAYVGLENIESNTGRILGELDTKGKEIHSLKYLFNSELVLYGKLRPYLNKVALPDFDGICSTDILPLLPNERCLTREYLAYFLRSSSFVEFATARSTGTKMPRFGARQLLKVAIPVPPVELQKQFAQTVQRIEALSRQQYHNRITLDALFQTLLTRAFRGELEIALPIKEVFPGITERQRVLLALVGQAAQAQQPVYITPLMKYAFLLQEESGHAFSDREQLALPLAAEARVAYLPVEWYEFEPYKYGPFAKDLYEDLEALEGAGLIALSHPPRSKGALREKTEIYLAQDQADTVRDLVDSVPADVRQAVDAIIEEYASLNQKQLLDLVYRLYPEYTVNTERK